MADRRAREFDAVPVIGAHFCAPNAYASTTATIPAFSSSFKQLDERAYTFGLIPLAQRPGGSRGTRLRRGSLERSHVRAGLSP